MLKKTKILFISSLFLIAALYMLVDVDSATKENEETLKINLFQVNSDNTYFDYRYNQFLILSTKNAYPSYYIKKINSLSGIPDLDSLLIGTEITKGKMYSREILFKDRFKRSEKYLENEMNRMSKNIGVFEINTVTGFKNNKQFVIVDANNNGNFSDDKLLAFDESFRYSHNNVSSIIDTLPVLSVKYQIQQNKSKLSFERKVQIYPYSNFFFTQYIKDNLTKQTSLMVKFKDYWSGQLKYSSIKYNIAIQGKNNKEAVIMIKPNHLKYKKSKSYNQNFEYRLKDTVSFGENQYVIDSIASDMTQLYLKKTLFNPNYYGHRIGNKIKDLKLKNLEGSSFRISDISKGKYTLLDFWGTWCKPCRELTPELKNIHKQFGDKVSIVGIAKDNSLDDVKKYVHLNGMKWTHAFERRDVWEGGIKSLKVKSYPTFILLDNKGTIIYRGGGADALFEIKKKLQN